MITLAQTLTIGAALMVISAIACALVAQIEALRSRIANPVTRAHVAGLAAGTAALLGVLAWGAV